MAWSWIRPLRSKTEAVLHMPMPPEVGHLHSMRLMKMQFAPQTSVFVPLELQHFRRYVGSERDATAFYAGSMTAFFLSQC